MRERYLEVTYKKGRPLAAYLYLPQSPGVKSVRTLSAGAGLLVDYPSGGDPIGLEITVPGHVTLEQINAVLHGLGQPDLGRDELAPLRPA